MSSNFFFPYRDRNALLPAGAFFSGVLGTPGGVRSQRRSVYEEHHNAGAFYNFEPRYTTKLAASYDRRKIGDEGAEDDSERNGAYFYGIKDDDSDGGSATATIAQKKIAPEKLRMQKIVPKKVPVQKVAPVQKIVDYDEAVKELARQYEENVKKQILTNPVLLQLLRTVADTTQPIQARRTAKEQLFGTDNLVQQYYRAASENLMLLIKERLKDYPGKAVKSTEMDVFMMVEDELEDRDPEFSVLRDKARAIDLDAEAEETDTRTDIDPLAEKVGDRFLAATQGQDVNLPDLNAIYKKYVEAQKMRNDMKGVREDWLDYKGSSISTKALKRNFNVMRLERINNATVAYNKALDADRNFLDALRIDNFEIRDWVDLSQFYKDGYTFKPEVRQKLTSLARELPTVAKIDDLRTILLGEQGQLAIAVKMEKALTLATVENLLATERAFMPPGSFQQHDGRDDMDVDSDDLEAAFDGVTTRSQMRQ